MYKSRKRESESTYTCVSVCASMCMQACVHVHVCVCMTDEQMDTLHFTEQ